MVNNVQNSKISDFSIDSDDVLRLKSQLCVPNVGGLRRKILEGDHHSSYTIQPGSNKMYQDLILEVVPNFIRNSFEASNNFSSSNRWTNNSYLSSIHMAPLEALYERHCRSLIGWFEVGEAKVVGLEFIQNAIENVKLIPNRLVTA
ncbi:uncharacterized protein [Cicer arietinum]|uniref:uncharacterized protein n=1 Tax=Cicer arietinum TaxID=3827 RepID=UPI00032AAB41